ncbi:MAG: lipopolysaccharide assembly protein LapA domain-containing protein [Bacillota bacterium]
MTWAWMVLLVSAVLVALFAGQNTDLVVVRFLGWEARTSQAVVIVLAALGGAALTILSALPQRVRVHLRTWDLQGQVRKLQEEKRLLSEQVSKAQEEARRLGDRLRKAEEQVRQLSEKVPEEAGQTGER